MHTKQNGVIVDYYPQTSYDSVIDTDGATLDVDITDLKNFKISSKTKLDSIEQGANKYVHPTTAGNLHIPSGGSAGQILRWSADGTAVWGADNNTTYGVATTTANGLMSAADKVKLNGIDTGANNYVHPGSGTNPHGTTKADVGLSNVNNWGATSAVNSTSTTTYATASAVKQAYDKAVAASSAGAISGCVASNTVKHTLINTEKINSGGMYRAYILARFVPKYTGTMRIKANLYGASGQDVYIGSTVAEGIADSASPADFASVPIGSVYGYSIQYNVQWRVFIYGQNKSATYGAFTNDVWVVAGETMTIFLFSTSNTVKPKCNSLQICYDVVNA